MMSCFTIGPLYVPGGIRTPDKRIRNPWLCPTELQAQKEWYSTLYRLSGTELSLNSSVKVFPIVLNFHSYKRIHLLADQLLTTLQKPFPNNYVQIRNSSATYQTAFDNPKPAFHPCNISKVYFFTNVISYTATQPV